jgi:hypothetical protein
MLLDTSVKPAKAIEANAIERVLNFFMPKI